MRLILSNIGVGEAKTTDAPPALPGLPGITTLAIEPGSILRAVSANESISTRVSEVLPLRSNTSTQRRNSPGVEVSARSLVRRGSLS